MKNNLYYGTAILLITALFLLDVSSLIVLKSSIIYSILCLYTILILDKAPLWSTMLVGILNCWYGVIEYGSGSTCLLYLIPIGFLSRALCSFVYKPYMLFPLTIIIGIGIKLSIIDSGLYGLHIHPTYIFWKICVNILVGIGVALTYKMVGNQDNRYQDIYT